MSIESTLERGGVALHHGPPLALPSAWIVLHAPAGTPNPLAPLLVWLRQADALLGDGRPWLDVQELRDGLRDGLRRRLMGELHDEAGLLARLVTRVNQLVDASDRPVVLAADDLDGAHAATFGALGELVARPGWLRAGLSLHHSGDASSVALTRLAEAVQRAGGEVVRLEAGGVGAGGVGAGTLSEGRPGRAPTLSRLPADLQFTLRAGATVGAHFEAGLVAAMLGMPVDQVLFDLQRASDLGVQLSDDGEGGFGLGAELRAEALAGVLPSLSALWHRRLAVLLETEPPGPDEAPGELSGDVPSEPSHGAETAAQMDAVDARPLADEDDAPWLPDAGRAAHHLRQAGRREEAIARHLEAARNAAGLGAWGQAFLFAKEALADLESLPEGRRNRVMRAEVLLELGRLQWRATGPSGAFHFDRAIDTLDAAVALLEPEEQPALRALLGEQIAAVCYDIGDRPHLDRALDELTHASRLHQGRGDAVAAAALLNEQAAVWVRLGDPVRAHHLLTQSRQVFARFADSERRARWELADTDHLIARLPLHVAARPGLEAEALEQADEHARAAVDRYQSLGAPREAARALTTRGQIALAAGRVDLAAPLLEQALAAQQADGDLLGLAVTAAALAQVSAREGRLSEALQLLGRSVALNRDKGSRQGLVRNREALVALGPVAREAGLAEEADALAAAIAEAEGIHAEGRLDAVAGPTSPS